MIAARLVRLVRLVRAVRRRRVAALALLLPLLSAACTDVFRQPETRPCPPIRLERTTAELTRFRPGPGRDLTDVVLEAELTGYQGTCAYNDAGDAVTVELTLAFAAALGPAADDRTQAFSYFVAVPRFFPEPAGKKVFEATITFPEGTDRVRYAGEELAITVPLAEGTSARDVPVYIGFQLSEAEVEYNRNQQPGRE
jgi:hypothetical protein